MAMPAPDRRPSFLPPQFDTPGSLSAAVPGPVGSRVFNDIEFGTSVGFRPVRMDLMVPEGIGPIPVVMFIHGGGFMFGSRRGGPVSPPIWRALLERGLAVAAVEYRLSGEAPFPACLHDVKAAVRWLRRFGADLGVDVERIGVWGESAGAHLSAFLALNNSDPQVNGQVGVREGSADVQAAVAWYPPTQFLTMDEDAPADSAMSHDAADSPESKLIGGPLQKHREAATFASPTAHVEAGAAPLLLMHGTRDRLVPFAQSLHLRDALLAVGAEVLFEPVEGAGHVFENVDPTPLISRSADYLRERLA